MADHAVAPYDGPETIEELTQDREKMWEGFTTFIVVAVVAIALLLIGMAVFLL